KHGGDEGRAEAAGKLAERGKGGVEARADGVAERRLDVVQSGTLMIKSPIRSGQSIFHAHGDVIVLGSVASGSEIVAAGSIHVYGTLRGRASAGVLGHSAARIFCRKNE
ncbi:septum site-determining protein MinC, partial [Mesorhizobium sp. M2D.F.Ca.ET.148.01.1.1]|uniref:septum site-determining protein MinC n=1 Tax=Mesorhizobium sp. M2D.F.Ca.ET.148.01.1.1 TaxID=2496665 RepID=UPI00247B02DD